jgi:formylglycine-generating enzyme required for sulfatase activity
MILFAACSKPPEGMIKIEEGESTIGSNEIDTEGKAIQYGNKKPWFLNEHPEHKELVKSFYIDKYEVTNKDYQEFVTAENHRAPSYWPGGEAPGGSGGKPCSDGQLVRCQDLLQMDRQKTAYRGGVGESRARRRRQKVSMGQRI